MRRTRLSRLAAGSLTLTLAVGAMACAGSEGSDDTMEQDAPSMQTTPSDSVMADSAMVVDSTARADSTPGM